MPRLPFRRGPRRARPRSLLAELAVVGAVGAAGSAPGTAAASPGRRAS